MGTRNVMMSKAAQRCIIFLVIIVCVHLDQLVTNATAETPACPAPVNSCSNPEANSCTSSSVDDGGDLHPVPDMIVLALLTAREDELTRLEIFFILIFPTAVFALFFRENLWRSMYPRSAQIMEQLVAIVFVNGVIALHLPEKFLWVPALCVALSLLTIIVALSLP